MYVDDENLIDGQTASGKERRLTALILLSIALLTIVDITVDVLQGVDLAHILIEALIIPMTLFGLSRIWRGFGRSHKENSTLRCSLVVVAASAAAWKVEAARHVTGLSDAIDQQLTRWGLTVSEKEIALLLLKGLSHKEIAAIRSTAERTTRQQALAIYEKSGLGGRAELSAFFLEDLLSPWTSN